MYLSRVEIPWAKARNPYDLHRCLWTLFPGQPREVRKDAESSRQGFLFRTEDQQHGRPMRVLVQSRLEPFAAPGITMIGCREINPQPQHGQLLAFILTANPVKTIVDVQREAKPGKTKTKCRVPLIREEEQLDWLSRKVDGAVEVQSVTIQNHAPTHFRKGDRAGKVATVTFDGLLRVRDAELLIALLENGIGPAKAFGCGLLLVRPVG